MLGGNPTNLGTPVSMNALSSDIDDLQTDVGDPSARTNDGSIEQMIGLPDTAAKDLYTVLVTDRLDHAVKGLSAIQVQVDDIQDKVDGTDAMPDAVARQAGRTQIKEFAVGAAANAGDTLVATITAQPILIKRVVIHAIAAQTGDMTSCALGGGAAQAAVLIAVGTAIQASLDAEDKQVSEEVSVRLAATKTISIDLQGTGATVVNLVVTIEYEACVDGGYLA